MLFQLTVAVLACLLFLASAIPMPFNAAALPGGWHYNGDVGRSCYVVVVFVVVVGFPEGSTCCCFLRIPRGCTSMQILIAWSGFRCLRVFLLLFPCSVVIRIELLSQISSYVQGSKLCHCGAHLARPGQQGVHLRRKVETIDPEINL